MSKKTTESQTKKSQGVAVITHFVLNLVEQMKTGKRVRDEKLIQQVEEYQRQKK